MHATTLQMLRDALAKYYTRWYPQGPYVDADENVTVVLGATEGFAVRVESLFLSSTSFYFIVQFVLLYNLMGSEYVLLLHISQIRAGCPLTFPHHPRRMFGHVFFTEFVTICFD